jgi:vacuolar-type H+-ATPase subunit I/STV1
MSNALAHQDQQIENLANDIEKELENLGTGVKDEAASGTIPMLDLKAIGQAYSSELKSLRATRRDFLAKKLWIEQSITILEKRIEINLNALKTIGMPVNELSEEELTGDKFSKKIDN